MATAPVPDAFRADGDGTPLRLTLLAMPCDASAPVLAALLAAPGVAVVRVGLAGAATGGSAPERAAAAAGVPAVGLRDVAAARAVVAADAPDAVAVACFPWKLPEGLLALPPLGCLNVHPSLLPLGRGPEPVFWTLRRGERETGPSVIRMDAGWDTGPLLAQERLPVPLGVRAPDLEAELMARGGRLLVDLLPRLAIGAVVPLPQADAAATAAPVPAAADWLMPTTLPARWAYGFARGVAPLAGPLAAQAGGRLVRVADALAWGEATPGEAMVEHAGGEATVRFRPGWVRFARR